MLNSVLSMSAVREPKHEMEHRTYRMIYFQGHRWRSSLCLLVTLLIFLQSSVQANESVCEGNPEAIAALNSRQNFTVDEIDHVGYGFYFVNPSLDPIVGGPNVTRGLVILPAAGISAAAYAPYARQVALFGYYVVIVSAATPGRVFEAMMQKPQLESWSLAGHGTGGDLAARMALLLHPKVKSVILIAAALPPDVNFRSINLYLQVIYGDEDTITTPDNVTKSLSRMEGDTVVTKISGFGHYDFAYSLCTGNERSPSKEKSGILNSSSSTAVTAAFQYSLALAQWFGGSKKALSFGDNHYLTPGFNDSKAYPGDIRVRFDELLVPNTLPQRLWWVFTPSVIKGGIVYYSGAAVDGRAYFPLAFEMAARGHLLVIPQLVSRSAFSSFQEATAIIDSKLPIFSGVPEGRWAVAGHSAGAAAAIYYQAYFGDKIYGTVMHAGRFVFNSTTSEVPVLQMYGSIDFVSGEGNDFYKRSAKGLFNPNKTTFVAVEGANHYQVGDYGFQYADQIATISLESQHALFAEHTVEFLDAQETRTYNPVLSNPVQLNFCAGPAGCGVLKE